MADTTTPAGAGAGPAVQSALRGHPPSYYAATANPPPVCQALQSDIKADVCVVGGGFTGLSAALNLAERGYAVALLEAERVGWGASGRNGGQLGSGQRRDPLTLEAMLGLEEAKRLWDLGELGKAEVKARIAKHGVACDLKPGILYAALRRSELKETQTLVERLEADFGYEDVQFLTREETAERVAAPSYVGGMLDRGAAHLHPLNYAFGLAEAALAAGARIYEGARAAAIEPSGASVRVVTAAGPVVTAEHAILGCNGYLGGLAPKVAAHVAPINNFVLATEPLGPERAKALIRDDTAVADSRFVVNYYRLSPDHRLLFGGGESYRHSLPADVAAKAQRPMLQTFPQLADVRVAYAWGGTLGITMSRLPHFARLAPNIFSASGYSGHGVGIATLAGLITAEAVSGVAERFDVLARAPTPPFPGGPAFRQPLLTLAMIWYALRDRL